jgi:hypothetical protein
MGLSGAKPITVAAALMGFAFGSIHPTALLLYQATCHEGIDATNVGSCHSGRRSYLALSPTIELTDQASVAVHPSRPARCSGTSG